MHPTPLVVGHPMNVALLGGELVANRLRARPTLRAILPTGHTPLGMYAALRAHAADGSLAADRATLFQLDEYAGLAPDDERSYGAFLRRELRGVGFGFFHGLDGSARDLAAECARHQGLLDEAPIDVVVLGIGRDGHVAFDEPGSAVDGGARLVRLHASTREDAAPDFGGLDGVPREALTVGLRTLLSARELLLLVTGEAKAEALRAMLERQPTTDCPASLIRDHPRLTIVADRAAASLLRPQPSWSSDRAVVVLGHREPGVSAEHRISDESRARIQRAVKASRHQPPRAVILTGYTRTLGGLSEAEQMKAEWPLAEVPALLEDGGRNTAENAACSLPIIRAIGDVQRVTVVTSAWHIRAPYFFWPYRALGLRLSFAAEMGGPWLRPLLSELVALGSLRAQRRRAMAAMRLPSQLSLSAGEASR
jgi:glucosamine-6-phosphate deaminase